MVGFYGNAIRENDIVGKKTGLQVSSLVEYRNVQGFTDLLEALQRFRGRAPDLMLPGMRVSVTGGGQLLGRLRGISRTEEHLAVLVITAQTDSETHFTP